MMPPSEPEALIERLERLVEEAADAVNRSDLARAEQIWRQALLAAPSAPMVHGYAAAFFLHAGRHGEAELLLRRALNRSPVNSPWEPYMRFTLACAQLISGSDIRSAWDGLRWRFAAVGLAHPELPGREWTKAGDWLSVVERVERDLAERTFTAFGAAA